ncbi:thermonuclease family protein [Candidatus Saccharibacteria bacterium]|nr:thermonuclease family protein [Candidatus Saccharibacteria bacterium]
MSGRHAKFFIGLTTTTAMALSGTIGVFSQAASARSVQYYRVLAYSAEGANTIVVGMNGRATKVRIIGINAPDATAKFNSKAGCYGIQARNVLKKIIRNNPVQLVADPKMPDRYTDGSLLRYVYVSKYGDVGATMIYNGAAKEYMYKHKNYGQRSWYRNLQNMAYSANRGLWNARACPKNR